MYTIYHHLTCEHCGADLTTPGAIKVEFNDGHSTTNTAIPSFIEKSGRLSDPTKQVSIGNHAGSYCASCEELLDEESAPFLDQWPGPLKLVEIVKDSRPSGIGLVAEIGGDHEDGKLLYAEMRVGFVNAAGECIGDVFFTVTDDGEPCVYITADGDGEGDHRITVFPLRAARNAVEVD